MQDIASKAGYADSAAHEAFCSGGTCTITKIILGIDGDNSNSAGGRFYEGAVSVGPVISKQTADALRAALVAVKYGK